MGKAIMGCAAMSADGYIAYDDGQIVAGVPVGRLHG
jgi:hypothetical protein